MALAVAGLRYDGAANTASTTSIIDVVSVTGGEARSCNKQSETTDRARGQKQFTEFGLERQAFPRAVKGRQHRIGQW